MAENEDAYGTFQGFLRTAIARYWDRKGSSKVTFIALLLTTRQAWAVGVEKSLSVETGKRVLMGAGGTAAVAVLLRVLLGGPLGLLLGGATVVSLLTVYTKNTEAIWSRVRRYHGIVDDYEGQYDALREQTKDAPGSQRDLIFEGLLGRFLDDLDAPAPEEEQAPNEDAPAPSSFAAHVARNTKAEE